MITPCRSCVELEESIDEHCLSHDPVKPCSTLDCMKNNDF